MPMQVYELTARDMLNHIVNDPYIHELLVPGMPLLDMAPFFAKEGNLMFGTLQGVMLFDNYGKGVYNAHVLFTQAMPRHEVKPTIIRMLGRVFTDYKARAIVASPANANRPARYMARAVGFAPYGSSTDSLGRPCTNYILERDAWVTFSAGLSQELGAISAPKKWPMQASTQQTRH